jgi:uncharacterized protein (DUF1778 family)
VITKTERLELRITPADKALIRQAAWEAGVSSSRFLTEAAVRSAEEAVARQNRFVVPASQWKEFAGKLDHEPHGPVRFDDAGTVRGLHVGR